MYTFSIPVSVCQTHRLKTSLFLATSAKKKFSKFHYRSNQNGVLQHTNCRFICVLRLSTIGNIETILSRMVVLITMQV